MRAPNTMGPDTTKGTAMTEGRRIETNKFLQRRIALEGKCSTNRKCPTNHNLGRFRHLFDSISGYAHHDHSDCTVPLAGRNILSNSPKVSTFAPTQQKSTSTDNHCFCFSITRSTPYCPEGHTSCPSLGEVLAV